MFVKTSELRIQTYTTVHPQNKWLWELLEYKKKTSLLWCYQKQNLQNKTTVTIEFKFWLNMIFTP